MPDIQSILGAEHEIFTANRAAWEREERRFYGRDAVLGDGVVEVDLEKFTNEREPSYRARKAQATYLNFPLIHAKILAGHLARVAPEPNYGTLGPVRPREEIPADNENTAEALHYNCDGVGKDGTQFRAWTTGVQERAINTGHRFVMTEMPRRTRTDGPVRGTEVRAGLRPFFVEYSPLAVPMWEETDGRKDWMVLRPRIKRGGPLWEPGNVQAGYYLLVRENYAGLGDQFAGGGWWLFNSDKTPVENGHGDWSRTLGQIPVAALVAESSQGTLERPAMSGSLTMELGQIATSLMNRISERNWDARDAAKSVKYILGGEVAAHNLIVEHTEENSLIITVPGSMTPEGRWNVPTIYDSSSGAVVAEVYKTIIDSTIGEAHEIMVRQMTSEPDSSGRSKEVGFGEATSPLLSSLAARRESFENTLIYFAELRAGSASPSGFVVWPTTFELAPVVAKIDQTIARMLSLGARSATLEAQLIEDAAKDDGVWAEEEETAIREELAVSLSAARPEQADTVQKLTASGGSLEGAANAAGLSDADITLLVGGPADGSADQTLPEAGAVIPGNEPIGNETGNPDAVVQASPQGGALRNAVSDVPPRFPDNRPARAFTANERPDDTGVPQQRIPAEAEAPSAPEIDLTPVTDRLDALTDQIAALVAALAQQPREPAPAPAQPPAPLIVFPPERPAVGKSVTVSNASTGDTWTVNVTPNGATPNATS